MNHFITDMGAGNAPTQLSWTLCNNIDAIDCDGNDCIWIVASDDRWRQYVTDAKKKTDNIILLTYKYDRKEMQTALVLGIRAYCHVLGTPSLFSSVTRVIQAGGIWLPNELLSVTTTNIAVKLGTQDLVTQISSLTNREKDVLSGILNGMSNKEIARKYGITERTVKEYVGTLLQKFKAKDRIGLLLGVGEFSHLKNVL